MDSAILFNTPHAVMYCMLLTTIIAVTADEPAAVPALFQRLWLRFQVFQETRKIKGLEKSAEKFWEIDMTRFEP
jgi:hypothetical protein